MQASEQLVTDPTKVFCALKRVHPIFSPEYPRLNKNDESAVKYLAQLKKNQKQNKKKPQQKSKKIMCPLCKERGTSGYMAYHLGAKHAEFILIQYREANA